MPNPANISAPQPIPTENLIHRAVAQQLKDIMFALLATHPELTDQVRALFRERPGTLSGSITTTAPLAALQVGWLYQNPDTSYWYRIVEISPLATPLEPHDGNFRNAILESALSMPKISPPSAAAFPEAIIDRGEPFVVKIPRGRL
jgi:hypothetical protein